MARRKGMTDEEWNKTPCGKFEAIILRLFRKPSSRLSENEASFIRGHWNNCPSNWHSDEAMRKRVKPREKSLPEKTKRIQRWLKMGPEIAGLFAEEIVDQSARTDKIIRSIVRPQ